MNETEHASSGAGKQALTMPVAIVIGAVVIAVAILLTNGKAPVAAGGGAANISVRAISASDHVYGNPKAPVVIYEFSDMQCPYCASVHPTLKRIVDESNGGVAWVYRHLPLESIHPEARPAANAAECVAEQLGNDSFWAFTDRMFENQQGLGDAYFTQVAKELGADMTAFASCTAASKFNGRIDTDTNEAIAAGGDGTPFSVVVGKKGGGTPVSGALPYAQFNAIVQSVK